MAFKRQDWFLTRVGKIVYRNKTLCDCKICEGVYLHGLMLQDNLQASYAADCEADALREGEPLQYFDTVQERDAFEEMLYRRNLPKHSENMNRCVEGVCEKFGIEDAEKINEFKKIVNNYLRMKRISSR